MSTPRLRTLAQAAALWLGGPALLIGAPLGAALHRTAGGAFAGAVLTLLCMGLVEQASCFFLETSLIRLLAASLASRPGQRGARR